MYPWAHFQYGGAHVAWCNRCDSQITGWTMPFSALALPAATRRSIDTHLVECTA